MRLGGCEPSAVPRTPFLSGAQAGLHAPQAPTPLARGSGPVCLMVTLGLEEPLLFTHPAPSISSSITTPDGQRGPLGGPRRRPQQGLLTCVSQTVAQWALHINPARRARVNRAHLDARSCFLVPKGQREAQSRRPWVPGGRWSPVSQQRHLWSLSVLSCEGDSPPRERRAAGSCDLPERL